MCVEMCADMGMDMCTDMCIGMCVNICVDMRDGETRRGMCVDMCRDMCIDKYIGMRMNMCVDMYVDVCTDMCMNKCIVVCRHVCRHARSPRVACACNACLDVVANCVCGIPILKTEYAYSKSEWHTSVCLTWVQACVRTYSPRGRTEL